MPVPKLPRANRNRRARRPVAKTPVFTAEFTTPNILLTFDVPVVLAGIPQFLTNTSKLPTAATQPTPQTIQLAYDTPGAVTSFVVPPNDPAIRSSTGGFCSPGSFLAS